MTPDIRPIDREYLATNDRGAAYVTAFDTACADELAARATWLRDGSPVALQGFMYAKEATYTAREACIHAVTAISWLRNGNRPEASPTVRTFLEATRF